MGIDYSQFKYYQGERECPFSRSTESERVRWWNFEKSYFDNHINESRWDNFMEYFKDWIIYKAAPENNGYDLSKGNPWLESYYENAPEMIMETSELISLCKYYKGETECPDFITDQNMQMFWFYESCWVRYNGIFDGYGEYEYAKLMDFAKDDDTPLSLKKLLFNRYLKGCWSIETAAPGFIKFYNEEYIGKKIN